MSDVDRHFHEVWLGMVQPIDGLVVSIPVLVEAQCIERQPPQVQQKLLALCPPTRQGEAGPEGFTVADIGAFLSELLGLGPDLFDAGDTVPESLSLYVVEGKQTLRPTMALRKQGPAKPGEPAHEMLVWEIPAGLDLDKPETVTGTWDYPPAAKLDRLLRHTRVPIGLLTNREVVRLVYAPHGESSGAITFRVDDMASVGGRPILDAFVMLLSANRFFGVTEERTLPAILAESRKRQANVTNELADQVFAALQILLRGFEAAAERDGGDLLDDALAREGDHLYKGLLTVLLRLVFILYAEDRALLPVEHGLYRDHLSVTSLFEQLQVDHGAYPDSMSRRFGAWGRLVTVFRAVYLGLSHGELQMPPRRGSLFNPHEYPFLEGWGPAGSAPITEPEDRAAVRLPTVDDETIFRVLEKLLVFEGQRLSYRALDVEQIGSVYEALMGYHVLRVTSDAVCLKPDRLWVSAEEVLEVPAARRAKWLKETIGLSAAQSEKLHAELSAAATEERGRVAVLEALSRHAAGGKKGDPGLSRARVGQLVLQPGSERRRTSSHYTPRSLSAPIVRRTLEPLLAVMGESPEAERILNLKVCDPAMGSGAFLVEACRFLADQVLAAWTREGQVETLAAEHGDPLLHARRLVAQRCLYGVDKNAAAVELAKLSLWLVTLSRTLPFTFLDHSLRHGDSLVGLDFDQIRAFHWKRPEEKKPQKQIELFGREIAMALDDAIKLRQKIGDLGDSAVDDKEKARLFWDAQDALERVRLIGDVIVGAFFAHEKDKDREAERGRREGLVRSWLASGEPATADLLEMQREIRERLPVFHWMVEFPEVFYAERPDPLDEEQVNRAAYMDAFVGNPPFLGGTMISTSYDGSYLAWLAGLLDGPGNRADLCAYFLRQANALIGANGTIGFIAPNAVAQGDTREHGLGALVRDGLEVYAATSTMLWPGDAAVAVALVHVAKGSTTRVAQQRELDGACVPAINSRLQAREERAEALPLRANAGLAFLGTKIYGQGFIVKPDERERLIATRPQSVAQVRPYIGGDEINSTPDQGFDRFVIDFGEKSLAEAEAHPELLNLLRERVKPEREATRESSDGRTLREYWWRFFRPRTELYRAIASLPRCLVNSEVSKHLIFATQPVDRVFSHTLQVYILPSIGAFATLQSRVHEPWARHLSGSFGSWPWPVLRYSATRCFETFPFPQPDPRTVIPSLENVGQRLYDFRAKYMVDENVGLTITYNRLKDPTNAEPRILELRALHEEMDRAVLAAYAEGDPEGKWLDVEVPPYCPLDDAQKKQVEAFGDAVIDRLFVLNAKRAEEERRLGLADAKGGAKGRAAAKKGAAAGAKAKGSAKAAGTKPAKAARPKKGAGQLLLGENGDAGAGDRGGGEA